MSDSNKISQGLVLSATVDMLAAEAAGQKMAQAIDAGFASRLQNWDIGTKMSEKILANLSSAISTGSQRQLEQLEKKLLSITTSMSRGRFDDAIERQLLRFIDLADRFGTSWHRAMGANAQAVFNASRAAPLTETERYYWTLQQNQIRNDPQVPYGFSSPMSGNTRFFAHEHGAFNQERMIHAAEAAENAWGDYYTAGRKTPAEERMAARYNAVHRAEIHSANEIGDQEYAAAQARRLGMLRNMAGPHGAHIVSGSSFEDQLLGGVIRSRAEAHSVHDIDRLDFIAHNQRRDSQRSLHEQRDREQQANIDANRRLRDYVHDNRRWMRRQGLTTDVPNDMLAYEADHAYHNLRGLEERRRGQLSRSASHRLRFASQNFAFGIDDAIQSYHYGGVGASIRAASNNVTAIAGMAITNPMIAAASVVALSTASAILPKIIDNMGWFRGLKQSDYLTSENRARTSQLGYGVSLIHDRIAGGAGLHGGGFVESLLGLENAFSTGDKLREQSGTMNQQKKLLEQQREEDRRSLIKSNGSSFLVDLVHRGFGLWDQQHAPLTNLMDEQDKNAKAQLDNEKDIKQRQEDMRRRQEMSDRFREQGALTASGDRLQANLLGQGRFGSGADLAAFITGQFTGRMGSNPTTDILLQEQLKDKLADKQALDIMVRNANLNRNLGLASRSGQHEASIYGYSGDTGTVGGLKNQDILATIGFNSRRMQMDTELANGTLSPADYNIQRSQWNTEVNAQQEAFKRNRQRAVEDDLDALNPERNPLRRQAKGLSRLKEDLALRQGLTAQEKEDQARAALIAAERRHDEYMMGGQRNYISSSTVGSIEDEELHARMTGSFGPGIQKRDHKGEGMDELLGKLDKLIEMLQFEAMELDQ